MTAAAGVPAAIGMSIADLREYTKLAQRGGTTLEATCDMLIGHRSHVEQKTDEWQNALALINEKIQFYSDWIEDGRRPPGHAPVEKNESD